MPPKPTPELSRQLTAEPRDARRPRGGVTLHRRIVLWAAAGAGLSGLALGLALTSPALAADAALPLEPGLYLPANIRCGDQDAATEVFNIDTRGVSTNRMACSLRAVTGRPGAYEATCREGEDAAAADQPAMTRTIRVLSPRSLSVDGENYRFCQALDD